MGETFVFGGRPYEYLRHGHNNARGNERTVEVPIALAEIHACAGKVLEVGNVLSNYEPAKYMIVDKYERAPGVVSEDCLTFTTGAPYDLIVSVSTLEHGWDWSRSGQGEDHQGGAPPANATHLVRQAHRDAASLVGTS